MPVVRIRARAREAASRGREVVPVLIATEAVPVTDPDSERLGAAHGTSRAHGGHALTAWPAPTAERTGRSPRTRGA